MKKGIAPTSRFASSLYKGMGLAAIQAWIPLMHVASSRYFKIFNQDANIKMRMLARKAIAIASRVVVTALGTLALIPRVRMRAHVYEHVVLHASLHAHFAFSEPEGDCYFHLASHV